MNQVISYSGIPDGPDVNTKSDVGKISDSPTTVPSIHDQDIVPSDAYVNMELGLPRGSYNALIHELVKIMELYDDGKPIGTGYRTQKIID